MQRTTEYALAKYILSSILISTSSIPRKPSERVYFVLELANTGDNTYEMCSLRDPLGKLISRKFQYDVPEEKECKKVSEQK